MREGLQESFLLEADAHIERSRMLEENDIQRRLFEGYELTESSRFYRFQVPDGTEVIVVKEERDKDWKIKKKHCYRTVLGQHRTVSGPMPHLVWEPSEEWPEEPPWQGDSKWGKWIYPDACNETFWVRKGGPQEAKA